MVISPNDFSLWARLTGNKYPSTPRERAQKGPEVRNFIQNLDKEGMLGGKQEEQKKKEKGLPEKLATGALIAGGIAAGVAAARDPRVQNVAQRAGSATKDKIKDFLVNFSEPRDVDIDIVNASGDVTPNPKEQQSSAPYWNTAAGKEELLENEAQSAFMNSPEGRAMAKKEVALRATGEDYNYLPQIENWKNTYKAQKAAGVMNEEALASTINLDKTKPVGVSSFQQNISKDNYTPLVQGETFFTEKGISKEDPYGDISNLEKRVDRTYGNVLNKLKPTDAASTRASLIREARKARDFDLGYMNAIARGRTDEDATITGRKFGGYDLSRAVRPQTPYRKALSELKIASTVPAKIDELLNLVETGPQIILPEKAQNQVDGSSAIVLAGGGNNTNVIPTMGATIGGSSLTDKHATKMAVDNALDIARDNYEKTVSTIVEAGQTKGGSISTAAKAEQFLQKMRPTVVKELDKAIQEDLTKTTGLNPEDAAFAADRSLNPVSGFVERNPDQSIAKKDLREERIAKIGEFVKPASNTGLRGTTGRPGIGLYGTPTETRKPGSESQPFGKGGVEVTKVTMQEGEGVPGRPDLGGRTETVPNVFDAGKTNPKRRTPEGLIYTEEALKKPTDMGGKQGFSSQPSTANPVESMQVADELRKIQTDQNISPEERKSKAKDFLKQMMAERGISAMGESEPLRGGQNITGRRQGGK